MEYSNITPIGITDFRDLKKIFGIKQKDRFGHVYVVGKTGSGKSTLLLNMACDDILNGRGLAIVDPHGDLSSTVLDFIPKTRISDVVYINVSDSDYPIAFNPLFNIPVDSRHLVASELVGTFKKLWSESWGPRLEYILRYAILTLLEYPEATLLDIQPLLTNAAYRNLILENVISPHIINFWKLEFEKYSPSLKSEAIAPILNKTGLFLNNTVLRNIVGQKASRFSVEEIISSSKILICNVSKGEIGEDTSALLGSMIVSAIQFAALRRSKVPENKRSPFFLYIDEMQSFVSLSLADILAEARKYKLSLFLSHQYLDQVHEKIRSAIYGNVGTIITFRVGGEDAVILAREFYPIFSEIDLIQLPQYCCYVKLLIDGTTSKPFSAKTLASKPPIVSNKEECIRYSRSKYTKPKCEAEQEIHKKISIIIGRETAFPSLFP